MSVIYLVVGPSGSGKTTLINKLCQTYGYTAIESYTTRPKRFKNERGHTFVTDEEFDKLKDKLVAYTEFDGHRYGATIDQVEQNDFYVIDEDGVDYFYHHYPGNKRIIILYIDCNDEECARRMKARGDSDEQIQRRLNKDRMRHSINRLRQYRDAGLYLINNETNDTAEVVNALIGYFNASQGGSQ